MPAHDLSSADSRREKPAHDFYWLLAVVLSVNLLLWLDSFDRYLNSRYHFYLSQYLPDAAFVPSRAVQEALNFGDKSVQTVSDGPDNSDRVGPEIADRQPAALEPDPGTQGQPASEVVAASGVASAGVSASAVAANGSEDEQNDAPPEAQPKVLFAGDSMMQGVAPLVISRMRREYPHGVFVDLSRQSTGLTVNRYFDWPAKIRDESIKQAFQVVVIFLGPNDPWDIYEGKRRYAFPSESWEKKYRGRVDEVLDFAASRGIRIIWIGLPVMREDRIRLGAKIENRIFQEETGKYKFDYLPTEDFLGALDEPYKKYIDDPQKGKLVVRADDGIHFTTLGLRMISSRVEELIRKPAKS